jgi:uncharacterized membrane protein HdeD (DUF308 family)
MKKNKFDSLFIGLLSLVSGIILTFRPSLISTLFYIAGAGLIIYNIFVMALGISDGKTSIYVPKGISGIIIGIAMIILPKFISVGVPIVIGFFFLLMGLKNLFEALENKKEKKIMTFSDIFSSLLLIVCGLFFITNAGRVSSAFVKLVGIVLIIVGVAILAIIFLRTKAPKDDDVIEIEDYSIDDDKK